MRVAATASSLAAVVALVFAPAAPAQVQRNRTVTPQQAAQPWTGIAGPGNNQGFDPQTATPCSANTAATRCDETLLNVDVAPSFWDTNGGGVEINVNGFTSPNDDFDLFVYRSNAAGDPLQLLTASAGPAGQNENVALQRPSGFFLVVVVYFQVGNGDTYTGNAAFFTRSKFPPDVDSPPGLQEALASDPGRGFQSHSEPHIAQSPTNPNVLVAASKMYNLDPDALAEYEFKIGSYASFDGGQSWHDLGQINGCPPDQAPPSSWPNNTCYPADDPKVGGTGAEDANDPRGNTDFGEEYIVSDVWTQFDDEGNAYAMVLDAPPFASGNGWGMSLHRWDSPSQADINAGQTWSNRIPINSYPQAASDPNFNLLDDKNSLGINNAGPDGDGVTGTMVACWTLDDVAQNTQRPQQIVCERSTDGGRSWPDSPKSISGSDAAVIGAIVLPDTRDQNTFYVAWLSISVSGGPDEIHVAKSTDGGVTWSAPAVAAQLTNVPNIYPRQAFRNLSLPSGGVGPNGEVYLSYADYRPAPLPGDIDGRQADIMLAKSTDGGGTWSTPVKVNTVNTDADQFQPGLAVTPRGQVDVSFFDRRLDPENFFIDTWLARSNDGGATFTDMRVSHDSWDPSINPPISDSGEFIGDYQGLVADDCNGAVPFVNNTQLANDAARDGDFDAGLPRSRFQEVFSWRVPNTPDFGGNGPVCPPPPAQVTPPKTTPPATTARGALLSLLSRRMRVSRTGAARFRLRCRSTARCRITLQLLARNGRARTRVARKTFTLPAATTRTVTLRVNRRGRRLLARRATVTASAVAVVTSSGRRATVRRTVTLVGPRGARRVRLRAAKVFGP